MKYILGGYLPSVREYDEEKGLMREPKSGPREVQRAYERHILDRVGI